MRKVIDWLLVTCCNAQLYEAIAGDLQEMYELDVAAKGQRRAARAYFINAIAFLRYHRLRKQRTTTTQNNMSLLKNYVKVSWRDLYKHKTYTSINLIGLVSAMTISLMILQYVVYETGFDRFHQDADRMYRVINDRYQEGELIQHGTITYPTIGPTMTKDFPEVESYTRMLFSPRAYVGFNDDLYMTNHFLIADNHFFSFFSFDLLHGNATTALEEPMQVVLTESFAKRLLPKEADLSSLIGKYVDIYNRPSLVTGISTDVPDQSHLQFDVVISYATFIDLAGEGADTSWDWSDFFHYVKLNPNVDVRTLDAKLEAFGIKYFKDGEVSGGVERFYLQPIAEAHLDNTMEYEIGQVVNGDLVWTLLVIAGFILLIAWVNYINLTTSRVLQRAKEVGIRKSVGAGKMHIIWQSIIESFIVNGIALVLSVALVWALQPVFNNVTQLDLSLGTLVYGSLFGTSFLLLFALTLVVSTVLLSLYPALLLSGFNAKDVIHGKYKVTGRVDWMRKGLVIFQFVTAIALINAALAISDQIDYMLNKDLGLDIKDTMVIYGPSESDWDSTFISKIDRFRNKVEGISGVSSVSTSNRVAGERMGRVFHVTSEQQPDADNLTLNMMSVDFNFKDHYNLKMMEGRGFEPTDHHFDGFKVDKIMLNEAATSYLGYATPQEAVGSQINFWDQAWTIVGVVNNFHQMTMHEKISPIVFMPFYSTENYYSVKLDQPATEAIIASVKANYMDIFPGNYFDYFFLEDRYRAHYQSEQRLAVISRVFTVLAIIMVILGIYGLITMALERKIKEIGIRKILGARVHQLLLHISKDFVWLMLVAIIIGIPLSIYLINLWKAGFAYTAPVGIDSFLLGIAVIMVFTSIPVLLQTRKVVSNNPVDSLRSE